MIGGAWAIKLMIIRRAKWCNPIVSSSNLGILGSVPGIGVPYLSLSTPGIMGSYLSFLCPHAFTNKLPYSPCIVTFMYGSEKSWSQKILVFPPSKLMDLLNIATFLCQEAN